jgi:uncharacterized membrane protein YphA (DoxX/SURF4 family)
MFLMSGGSKLAGVPAMVSLFDAIGLGQWFRYVTGVIEVAAGTSLLVPAAAVPLVLLLLAAAVAWARRDQVRIS